MDRQGPLASWRVVRTQMVVRRRLVVAILTGVAVVSGLSAVRPAAPATRRVWVAAHDLPGGQPLSSADLRIERLPISDVPRDAVPTSTPAAGMLLAAPMRQGEPLTDVRVLSSALLAATDENGDVAVPVRVADGPATLALVHAGDLVDVIAAPDADTGRAPPSFTVVRAVRVLATPSRDPGASTGSSDTAGLLIVAATEHQAAALARVSTGAQLSIAVRRDP